MRFARYLLIFLFLPVSLVAASALPASAVDPTLYGEKGTTAVQLDETGYRPYANANCGIAAWYQDVNQASEFVLGTIFCNGENSSAFNDSYQNQKNSSTRLFFHGLAGGEVCTLSTEFDENPDHFGTHQTGVQDGSAFSFGTDQYFYGEGDPCIVTEVCVEADYTWDVSFAPDWDWHYAGCAAIDLNEYPKPGDDRGTCQYGTPKRLDFFEYDNPSYNGYHQHHLDLFFKDSPTRTGEWGIYFYSFTPGNFSGTKQSWDPYDTAGQWVSIDHHQSYPTNLTRIQSNEPSGHIKGIQIFSKAKGGYNEGHAGLTKPADCLFWFSDYEVQADQPDGSDVPYLPMNVDQPPSGGSPTPPGDTSPPSGEPTSSSDCNFDPLSPSTWLEGGMCAVVGLLQGIWNTLDAIWGLIGGLPGAIASAIGGLFLPESGALDAAFSDVSDAFDGTAPGQWMDAVTGQSLTGSQSGCAGPTIAFHTDMASVNLQPFNACSGIMATVASIVKLVLSAGLVLGGGMACLRALGSGFGWNPAVGEKS